MSNSSMSKGTRRRCAWSGALFLAAFTVACGSDDSNGGDFSCTAAGFGASDAGVRPPAVCVEGAGATPDYVEKNRQDCAKQGGAFALGPCSHAGAVGGCRVSSGSESVTTWYYGGDGTTTTADVQKICAGLASVGAPGATIEFVPP